MKRKILLLGSICFVLTLFLVGCSKDEDDPEPTTGGLIIKVQLEGSTGFLNDGLVGLATSQDNLDNSVYLKEVSTNENGEANFGQLNPGNYFYDCIYSTGGVNYYGEGQVEIKAGTNLTLTLTISNN
jgi:hypothetical protein